MRTVFFISLLLLSEGSLRSADIVQTLFHSAFDQAVEQNNWRAERNCRLLQRDNLLHIEALTGPPQIYRTSRFIGGNFRLLLELRTATESEVSLYWTSRRSPRREDSRMLQQSLIEDGDWHTYEFAFSVPDVLETLSLRLSSGQGSWEIRTITLIRRSPPPFTVRNIDPNPIMYERENGEVQEMVRFTVSNDMQIPMQYRIANQQTAQTLANGQTVDFGVPVRTAGNLASVVLTLYPEDFPRMVHPVFLYRPEGQTDWIRKTLGGNFSLEIAADARMARIRYNGELLGIIAPLVHRAGEIPSFVLSSTSTESDLLFESSTVDLRITLPTGEVTASEDTTFLTFDITDKSQEDDAVPLEGLAVRLLGNLQSGLLPGVEFLKAGDVSSSEIDIIPPDHNRSIPNPLWLTMLMAVLETEKGGAALYWDDASLQPAFSSPNRFDLSDDHRYSLRGKRITASLELFPPTQSSDKLPNDSITFKALRSYVAQKGFPSPPPPLRETEEQLQLVMTALTSGLQSEMGEQWGYALEPEWERQPFADIISTMLRLSEITGRRMRNPHVLVPGGNDISNDAIYFIVGRIPDWQQEREKTIRQIIATANPDGSFLFYTRFPDWETAASSYGYTALKALEIMEYTRATGNQEFFAVVTKALDYLEDCEIPSGGYFRDSLFSTPDLQTAGVLVWLYVWAYEFSGNTHYLERAKHFALGGLPFVYQVSQKEHMLYGTVGKFGGTHRRPPLHFGVLTPRVGLQYAYALNLLAKHDKQTDWKTVSWGILHAVENLQYTEDIEAGCIPELFDVVLQERSGSKINPCSLVSLRWVLEGKVDSLFVLIDGTERYTAPYPLRRTEKGIESYNVPLGQPFHILHNGNRFGTGEGNGIITVD